MIWETAPGTTEDAYSTMMDTADGKMKQVKQTANDLFIKLFEKADPVIMAVLDGFQWMIENAKVLAPFLVALGVALAVFQIQATIAAAAEAELTVAQYLLNGSFLACPLTWFILGIAAVVAAIIYLWNNCDWFRQFWIDLWQKIKDIFFTVWDAVKSFFTEKIPEMFNNLLQWFIELPDNIAYWLGFALGKIIAWCITLPQKAREAGKAFLENVINFFKNLPSRIATWLLNAAVKVVEWRSRLIEKGKAAAKGLLQAVVNGLKELPHKMLSIGVNIVKGLWNGIQNMIGWFKNKIHSFFSGIVDGAKSALGIHSPSKKFAWIGKMCIEGFEDPFDDYDPYKPFNDAMSANIGTMRANMIGSSGDEFNYSRFADATVDAFERAGFTFRANNRELGRFVRGVSMA